MGCKEIPLIFFSLFSLIAHFLYFFAELFLLLCLIQLSSHSSETISGYDGEESLELPLKFEDIVDKYYDKMRPPRTGGETITSDHTSSHQLCWLAQ